jgi:hypothetical protein
MNVAIANIENGLVEPSEQTPPQNIPASNLVTSPELSDETFLDEATERKLYRRSVAYFIFGFGYNRHSILTDDPESDQVGL